MRNMLGGIGLALLSGARNKKIMVIAGAVLMAIGIGGMITVGSRLVNVVTQDGFANTETERSLFYGEYAFLFTLVAGLGLMIYGVVSIQKQRGKERSVNR
jgi:MFS family permease